MFSSRLTANALRPLVITAFLVILPLHLFAQTYTTIPEAVDTQQRDLPEHTLASVLNITSVTTQATTILPDLSPAERAYIDPDATPAVIGVRRSLPEPYIMALDDSHAPPHIQAKADQFVLSDSITVLTSYIQSLNAGGMRIKLTTQTSIGSSVKFYVYTADGQIFRPYDASMFYENTLWSHLFFSDAVFIQVQIPHDAPTDAFSYILIEEIAHIDTGAFDRAECLEDVSCDAANSFPHISSLRRAVTRIVFQSTDDPTVHGASGALLNNANPSQQFQPLVQTVGHVINSEAVARHSTFFFDYRTTSCDGGTAVHTQVSGASRLWSVLEETGLRDYSLLLLAERPSVHPDGRVYLGSTWHPVDVGSVLHSVNHPNVGDRRQKYARATKLLNIIPCAGWGTSANDHLGLSVGAVLDGSSGGPCVNETGHVVGALRGLCGIFTWPCSYWLYNVAMSRMSYFYPSIESWLQGTAPVNMTYTPSSLNFGSVGAGSVSGWLDITFTNQTTSGFNLDLALSFTGAHANQFRMRIDGHVSSTGSLYIPRGSSKTVEVRFQPNCGGSMSASLRVEHNATSHSSPITIALSGCGIPETPPPISGTQSPCSGQQYPYSISAVCGATSYTWEYTGGGTPSGSGTSVTLTPTSSGTLRVRANNSCGSSSWRTLAITVIPVPPQPGQIYGETSVCGPGDQELYSVDEVPGATSYEWTLPSGWSGSSNTRLIVVTTGSSGGYISVRALNSCGPGQLRSLYVSVINPPGQTGPISGPNQVCSGATHGYSISPVGGATSYTWEYTGGGTPSGSGTSITLTPTSSGTLRVRANNDCGSSNWSTKPITVVAPPPQPGPISGPSEVCVNTTKTYSIDTVGGATSYTWEYTGSGTPSGSGTSVTLTPTSSGTLRVKANNDCGSSGWENLEVSVSSCGSLLVTLLPPEAVSDGAQWNLNDGPWQNSGTTIGEVFVGDHDVAFKEIDGWMAPDTIVVTIVEDELTEETAAYTRVGACCDHEGTCDIVTEDSCEPMYGEWMGAGTLCEPDPCPPLVACCLPDGNCWPRTENGCQILFGGHWYAGDCFPDACRWGACCYQGSVCNVEYRYECTGLWMGAGTLCDPNPCPGSELACCYPDGSCVMQLESVCWSGGGVPGGVSCQPNPCDGSEGACCFEDGSCQFALEGSCPTGNWLGMGTVCEPNPCDQPPGACCFRDEELIEFYCEYKTEESCGPEWSWLGPGTVCDPNPCPDAQGACCCLGSGACHIMRWEECDGPMSYPMEFLGPGTSCDPNPCPQPSTGACCFSDGQCELLAILPCEIWQGGFWQGQNTVCDPNPCPGSEGACCQEDGSCHYVLEADCPSGDWLGMGTVCDPNPCDQPIGACCFPDGTCLYVVEADCEGDWLGMDTACDPNPCDQPEGACCHGYGGCEDMTEAECPDNWLGPFTSCFEDEEFCGHGACCFDTGACAEMMGYECLALGGSWRFTAFCIPNPCQPGPGYGACCYPPHPYNCNLDTDTMCQDDGGIWMGEGVPCLPTPCRFGACCYPDGSCEYVVDADCPSGDWLGLYTFCNPNPCPQPLGACCLEDGSCLFVTEAECEGYWLGMGTVCDPNPCPPSPQSPPEVTNVTAAQTPGTMEVLIAYDLYDADGDTMTVALWLSEDGGITFPIECVTATGHIGEGITSGTDRQIVWDAGVDYPGHVGENYVVMVTAGDGQGMGKMIWIPAGNVRLGLAGISNAPPHNVLIEGFWIGKYEVTNGEYAAFITAGGYTNQAYWNPVGWNWRVSNNITLPANWNENTYHGGGIPGNEQFPANGVSWWEADAYCRWAGKRLPTEAEWEKAAKGGCEMWGDPAQCDAPSTPTYPWGEEICGQRANYQNSGDPYDNNTTPVGYYDSSNHGGFQTIDSPSPYGLYDVAGNVWEWSSTEYRAYPYVADDGREEPPSSPYDPHRVLRGGSWYNHTGLLRCAHRSYYYHPYSRGGGHGFRCASDSTQIGWGVSPPFYLNTTELGACCFPDGSCEYVLEADCTTDDWRILEPCDPNPCPVLLGACCLDEDTCLLSLEAECSGTFLGAGTVCDPNPCGTINVEILDGVPHRLQIRSIHPNPTTGMISFGIDLPSASRVKVSVVDVTGKVVATLVNRDFGSGSYLISDIPAGAPGRLLQSGVYFLCLEARGERDVRKFILTR